MFSIRPAIHAARKLGGARPIDIEQAAVERWTISPATRRPIRPAYVLPGQLERICKTEFGTVAEVVRDFQGGYDAHQPETYGFRIKDADLVDGVLYAGDAASPLRPRARRFRPVYRRPKRHASATLFESWVGNRWFGNWLINDCLTYALSREHPRPVMTRRNLIGHMPQYAQRIAMQAASVGDASFDELILFGDASHNDGKRERADRMRAAVIADARPEPHVGTFLLRGTSGDRRVLVNEREIAEFLAERHGFRVIDPVSSRVDDIVEACAGARILIGVEGSQLAHGLIIMPPTATLLTLQPPARVTSALKIVTDRQGQGFALVIGTDAGANQFHIDPYEIERTLDLIAS